MALLFCESFETYGSPNPLHLKYTDWLGNFSSTYVDVESLRPRTNTYSLERWGQNGSNYMPYRATNTSATTVGVSFGIRLDELNDDDMGLVLQEFRDSNNAENIVLICRTDGSLTIVRGSPQDGTVLGTTTPLTLRAGVFRHIEVKCLISSTATGSVEVRVNGTTVINVTNTKTTSGVLENGTGLDGLVEHTYIAFPLGDRYVGTSNDIRAYYDDIVIYDDTGSYNNDFIGDARVYALRPNGNTATANWTGDYTDIDGLDPNEVDYASANSALTSLFDIENLPVSTGEVRGAVATSRLRKDDDSTANFQHGIKSGASTSTGSVHSIGPAYEIKQDIFETDPASGVAFTPSEINSLQLELNRT